MNLDNKNLEWKLCEAYFSILDKNRTSQVSLAQLSIEAKISIEEVEKLISNYSMYELAKLLFPFPRSLTGEGIKKSFDIFRLLHSEFKTITFK